jgi:hypothetical protein
MTHRIVTSLKFASSNSCLNTSVFSREATARCGYGISGRKIYFGKTLAAIWKEHQAKHGKSGTIIASEPGQQATSSTNAPGFKLTAAIASWAY